MLASGAVLRNSLRSLRSLRSNNRSKSEHIAWACCAAHARPSHCASRHGQRGHQSRGRAQRWPVSKPLWLRLRRGACGVARAPQDARASCSDSPRLFERSAQRAVSSAAHPASAVTQVCPVAQRRGRRLGGAFFCLLFLCVQEKEVRRRAHLPASRCLQSQQNIEQQPTHPTPESPSPQPSPQRGEGAGPRPQSAPQRPPHLADHGGVVGLAENGAAGHEGVGPGVGHPADVGRLDAAVHLQANVAS